MFPECHFSATKTKGIYSKILLLLIMIREEDVVRILQTTRKESMVSQMVALVELVIRLVVGSRVNWERNPLLVVIIVRAGPDLNLIRPLSLVQSRAVNAYLGLTRLDSTSQVDTLVMPSPADSEIRVHSPLLVLVTSGTLPDLE